MVEVLESSGLCIVIVLDFLLDLESIRVIRIAEEEQLPGPGAPLHNKLSDLIGESHLDLDQIIIYYNMKIIIITCQQSMAFSVFTDDPCSFYATPGHFY